MRPLSFFGLLAFALPCGCELELPGPAGSEGATLLEFDPAPDAGSVSPTVRVISERSVAPLPRLFEGELSGYHLSRADDDDLIGTLAPRLIPLWVKRGEAQQEMRALRWLTPGLSYAWVSARGRQTLITPAHAGPWLRRIWPRTPLDRILLAARESAPGALPRELASVPNGAVASAHAALYCTSDGSELARAASTRSELSDGSRGSWFRVPGRDDCTSFELDGAPPARGAVTPAHAFAMPVEPLLFVPLDACTPAPAGCAEGEHPIAVGCAKVSDDRLEIRSLVGESLWLFDGDLSAALPIALDEPATQRGLTPEKLHRVSLEVIDLCGNRHSAAPRIQTGTAAPHVVISEVMANPLGPEPAQEWIELTNDGASSEQLAGWSIEDSGASTPLPSFELLPGHYVLVVSEAYDAAAFEDVPAAPGTAILRVPRLGKSGLSNSGESLTLRSPDGAVRSRFPAEPKPAAGLSVARVAPHASDAALASFGHHAEPGASPGSANEVP